MIDLNSINTIAQLGELKLDDLNLHIIVGGNGRCMCGIYDGIPMSCWQIVKRILDERLNTALELWPSLVETE